jgi:hypothetical protein
LEKITVSEEENSFLEKGTRFWKKEPVSEFLAYFYYVLYRNIRIDENFKFEKFNVSDSN